MLVCHLSASIPARTVYQLLLLRKPFTTPFCLVAFVNNEVRAVLATLCCCHFGFWAEAEEDVNGVLRSARRFAAHAKHEQTRTQA